MLRTIGILAATIAFTAGGTARAGDAVTTPQWMVAETVELVGHSPHNSLRLYEQGSVDALGFRPDGGEVYCFSVEIWMADGRRSYVENRTFEAGEVGEFVMVGTNRTIDRIEYSCHPRFGVTAIQMEILVR